jgi:hypothetical protein
MSRRRILDILAGCLSSTVSAPALAYDNENGGIGIVTESDLGVSVRRSVVRAAQFMDRVDGSWENLSDRFGLGEARQKQDGRPAPKTIPDLRPLDSDLAMKLLRGADQAVVKVLSCRANHLDQRVEAIRATVQPSFERAGLKIATLPIPSTAEEFNFLTYVHYKAYIDMFGQQQSVGFVQFKDYLETTLGQLMLDLLLPSFDPVAKGTRCEQWQYSVNAMEKLKSALVTSGLVAAVDLPAVDDDVLLEWCEEGGELTFSLALDGEATLNAQCLLQEQGYRLYPSFCKLGFRRILQRISSIDVAVDG